MDTTEYPNSVHADDSSAFWFDIYLKKLQHLAYRGLYVYELKRTCFSVVCIAVVPEWQQLTRALFPQWVPRKTQTDTIPVCIGLATHQLARTLANTFTNDRDTILEPPEEGMVRVFILDHEGGCGVYGIKPQSDLKYLN